MIAVTMENFLLLTLCFRTVCGWQWDDELDGFGTQRAEMCLVQLD